MKSVMHNVTRSVQRNIRDSWSRSWTPQIPTDLTLTVISDTSIQLDWVNVDTTGDGVSIERSTDGVAYSEIDTVALGVDTFTDTGLSAGTLYYYRIRAFKN